MVSSTRYLGTAAGFGFGVIWMTVGIGSAILVLLCAALGFGIAFVAERERADWSRFRRSSGTEARSDALVGDFELEHFARRDEVLIDEEPSEVELVPVSGEAEYGWPTA